MTNFDNRDIRNQPTPTNPNLSSQADLSDGIVERPPTANQTAYRDGYQQGRYSENRVNETIRARENESASSGVLLGLLLAGLLGLGAAAYYFFNEQNRRPNVVVPNVVVPKPSPSQKPEVRERIIERDRIVPVPQQAPQAPDVNVTIPNPAPETRTTQPAPQAAPQAAPQSTAPQNTENTAPANSSGNAN